MGLLQQGVPYREIHKQTGVSVTTIGRVARYLTNGNGGYTLAADTPERTAADLGPPAEPSWTKPLASKSHCRNPGA